MREDGGLTGYGMATALDGGVRRACAERIHAALPAALCAQSCPPAPAALIAPEITSIARRPLTGRRCGSRRGSA